LPHQKWPCDFLHLYYDLHTHKIPEGNEDICSIVNVSFCSEAFAIPSNEPATVSTDGVTNAAEQYCCSIGIHPWHIKTENIQKNLDLIEKYATFHNVKAIGECGLDKLCRTDFNLQKEVFLSQIAISEKAGKPLIIHCVKSFDEMVDFKKKTQPRQAWIIHGFRGKPEQAIQLTNLGFYLSFGLNYNEESLKKIPMERLFLETDDSDCDIQTLYQKAAKILRIPEQKLVQQIGENVNFIVMSFS